MTDQQIRLQFGEMNADEMRLARAIVGWYERQIEELKRWKAEAQTVEAEWNPQELAKLLGANLGQSCRQVIQKRVPEILAENAKLRASADAMFTALNDCREDTCELIAERDWWKDEPRCRYDVRYQEMKDRLNAAIAALAAYQATKQP